MAITSIDNHSACTMLRMESESSDHSSCGKLDIETEDLSIENLIEALIFCLYQFASKNSQLNDIVKHMAYGIW